MTPVQKRAIFVRSVLAGNTPKKSAIKAGYSKATASAAGSRLLKHPQVVQALAAVAKLRQQPGDDPVVTPASPPVGEPISPLRYMLDVVNDPTVDRRVRLEAARSAAPYVHARLGMGIDAKVGKKEQKQEAAKTVASRFAPGAPPRLAAAGGKKL